MRIFLKINFRTRRCRRRDQRLNFSAQRLDHMIWDKFFQHSKRDLKAMVEWSLRLPKAQTKRERRSLPRGWDVKLSLSFGWKLRYGLLTCVLDEFKSTQFFKLMEVQASCLFGLKTSRTFGYHLAHKKFDFSTTQFSTLILLSRYVWAYRCLKKVSRFKTFVRKLL